MMFLAMIIALVMTQIGGADERVQQDDWFARWQSRVETWGVGAGSWLALVVLLPALVAQGLLNALDDRILGLPWIALGVVLLLYSFGREDFQQLMARYQGQCRSADFEGAYLATLPELGWSGDSDDPGTPQAVHALVQHSFFYQGYQRWFAVLFYFVLLGPAGALAYRLLQLCRHSVATEQVGRCLFFVDWLPARLLAATFSLTGDFVCSRAPLLAGLADVQLAPGDLLDDVGTAALSPWSPESTGERFGEQAAEQNIELGSLMSRSAAGWVALISLVVLLD